MPDPRTVALAFHNELPTGAIRVVARVLPELEELGWKAVCWVPDPSELADWLRAKGIPVEGRRRAIGYSRAWWMAPPGPSKARHTAPWLTGWAGFLRRHRPAVVHANTLFTLPEATVARALRLPTVMYFHEMLPEGRKGRIAARAIRALQLQPATVSAAAAERFAAAAGVPPRIVHGSTPVPDPPVDRAERDGRVVVGTVGWVEPRKGTDLFIAAARRVMAERPGVEFRLIGNTRQDSPHWPYMQAQVQAAVEAGIDYRSRAKVMEELREWDIAVITSRFDPFPLVVLESMASGLPVVGTAVDGIAEQITPETGLLARPEDPHHIAAQILALVDDPVRRQAMGRAGRQRIVDNFTAAHQARGLDEAYRAAIGRG